MARTSRPSNSWPPARLLSIGSHSCRTIRRMGDTGDVTVAGGGDAMNVQTAIQAPRGSRLRCKGWRQQAALRMLHNNLEPEVAEKPDQLIVYGGTGRAARDWASFHAIVRSLESLGNDETLLVQSGRPVGIFRTHSE